MVSLIFKPLPTYYGFGDIWALTNFLLTEAEISQKDTKVTVSPEIQAKIEKVKPYLKSNFKIIYCQNANKIVKLKHDDFFKHPMLPTRKKWSPQTELKKIAYQFNGIHLASEKNPPKDHIKLFINELVKKKYKPVDVGNRTIIDHCIELLSRSIMFIGCPSGLSIIAMSVGLPIHLVTYRLRKTEMARLLNNHYQHAKINWHNNLIDFCNHL